MEKSDSFHTALTFVLRYEGKLSNVKSDHGGQTYCGISRKFFPNWEGWQYVDKDLGDVRLGTAVEDFYYKIWQHLRCDEIVPELALAVFDIAINMGEHDAGVMLQTALQAIGYPLLLDGDIGNKTIATCKASEKQVLFILLYVTILRIRHYRAIVMKDRSQEKFLLGWLNRTIATIET